MSEEHQEISDKTAQEYQTKTEDGRPFPPGDYAYVPDRERPSTWKLRLTSTPGGPPDPRIVGAAVAALGPGFRGQKVQIPSADLAAVKRKVRAAWRRAHPDASPEDVPAVIRASEDTESHVYADIRGVEIFRTGKWNGDTYQVADLDEMVANFGRVGFRPPVKLGHKEVSGGEAFGWVKEIRRQGEKLVADFMDVPAQLLDKIRARAFDTVSSEIFWNLQRNGQKFRRVLKAVALLGAETPAVSGLKPLRENAFSEDELLAVHTYELHMEDFDMSDDDTREQLEQMQQQLKAAQERITELTTALEKSKEGDDLALQLKNMRDSQEEMAKKLAQAEERERRATVQNKVDKLRVPAFKDHVRALYEFTSAEPSKTVRFSTLDDKGQPVERETPFEAVLDDMVDRLNKTSEYLFQEHSVAGDWQRDDVPVHDDPGLEVDRLAKGYAAKHDVDYTKALNAILEDPENAQLKIRWARAQQ